jgi:hypothetical protein
MELICEMSNGDVQTMKKNPWEFETQRLKFQEENWKKVTNIYFSKAKDQLFEEKWEQILSR